LENRKTVLFLTFWLVLILKQGISQYERLPIENYTTNEFGIQRSSECWAITQDSRGIMYFGNAYGVLEYDGLKWDFIRVGHGHVSSLACGNDGKIYVGTENNFGFLAPNKEGVLTYFSLSDSIPEEDQFFSQIWRIYVQNDCVWFFSNQMIFKYQDNIIKSFYPSSFEHEFSLSFSINNDLYVRQIGFDESIEGLGLQKISEEKIVDVKGGDFFKGFGISALFSIDDNTLLVVSFDKGLWLLDEATGDVSALNPDKNTLEFLEGTLTFGGIKLHDGSIALFTNKKGIGIIDHKGRLIKVINQNLGLKVNDIKVIFQDKDNNIWAGTSNGISKINYTSPFSFYQQKSGIDANVYSIIESNEVIYVGTSNGLLKYNKIKGDYIFEEVAEVTNQVWDIMEVEGEVIVSGNENIFLIKDENVNVLANAKARSTVYYPEWNLLVSGNDYGLFLHKKDAEWKYLGEIPLNLDDNLKMDVDPNSNDSTLILWVGLKNEVYKIIFNKNLEYQHTMYSNLEDGLYEGVIIPAAINDKMLFGTSNGILKFVDEETIKNQLPDSLRNDPKNYKGFFEDTIIFNKTIDGEITLLCKKGDKVFYVENNNLGYFDSSGKFHSEVFRTLKMGKVNTLDINQNNDFWIGLDEGLAFFNSEKEIYFDKSFDVNFRKVITNDDSVLFIGNLFVLDTSNVSQALSNEQETHQIPVLEFKPKSSIIFTFSANQYNNREEITYSYKLEGFDDEWSRWQSENRIVFNNLKEGNYQLLLKAKNIYGIESNVETYSFIILKPWYRTQIAYISYFILFSFIVFVSIRLGQIRLKRKNERLEEIVRKRTREIHAEKEKSEKLLLNTLPVKVVEDLKRDGISKPENFDNVSVYFSDFVGFTNISANLEPEYLIKELNDIFTAFDDIMSKYHCERIKTIGDAYMAVCGMPEKEPNHAKNMVLASMEILKFLEERNRKSELKWEIRVGINSGKVVGGIVGVRKYLYDVFGNTINTASRMESNSVPMRINVSQSTYDLVKNEFNFEERKPIVVKGLGLTKMYFVEDKK
jgi:class 3 adenylate cyclase